MPPPEAEAISIMARDLSGEPLRYAKKARLRGARSHGQIRRLGLVFPHEGVEYPFGLKAEMAVEFHGPGIRFGNGER